MHKQIALFVFAAALLAMVLGALALLGSAPAQAAVTTNISVPFDTVVFVPCANGGAGEDVHLTGDLHIVITSTADGAGGFHDSFHAQPQGISGTGSVTGAKYQATGVTRGDFNVKPPYPFETTFVNNFRIIGQGPGNNFLVHENFHVTVNANGTLTASVDNFSVECK